MAKILGISAFYHDSAAVLLNNDDIVAAAQEERFTRNKHDHDFPQNAIDYCLQEAGISGEELDYVAFYDKPILKFERLLETYLSFAPVGFRSFLKAMPIWLKTKLHLPREMRKGLGDSYKKRFIFPEHHESHAASAFFPSPFEEAAIITLDGVGEWATASLGKGSGNKIELSHEMHFPHSIGLLYSAFTYFCGFRVNSGEYKLMGLAPYGEPKYYDLIMDNLIDLKSDGSFRMDMSYFNYCQGLTMTSRKMDRLFGGPPRKAESELTQREMDIAASIQNVTEEIVLRMVKYARERTGSKNLCLAGGVALNCVANGRVLRESPFEEVWIQPAAGDAGGALGAALFVWHQLLDKPRQVGTSDSMKGSLLGPKYSSGQIRKFLVSREIAYTELKEESELCDFIADQIASEKVVGLYQGRMEFGPRALGCRSIIGDARSTKMQSVMNLKIKFRESFRPFAPSVLRDHVHDFFQMRDNEDSPYMLLVADVQKNHWTNNQVTNSEITGLDKLKTVRSNVPAITHVDYSARVQTVDPVRHGRYYNIINRFREKTGCPVIINTSFNVRGEPIVCTPQEAFHCFMATDMDVLVLENMVLRKEDLDDEYHIDKEAYLSRFELD